MKIFFDKYPCNVKFDQFEIRSYYADLFEGQVTCLRGLFGTIATTDQRLIGIGIRMIII